MPREENKWADWLTNVARHKQASGVMKLDGIAIAPDGEVPATVVSDLVAFTQ